MSDQRQSYGGWIFSALLMVAMAVYASWRLEGVEERVAPTPPATFESRVEAVRSEGTDWATGYFYVVGKTSSQTPLVQQLRPAVQWQDMPQEQLQMQQRTWTPPVSPEQRLQDWAQDDPILRDLQRQNEAFERSMRSRAREPDVW